MLTLSVYMEKDIKNQIQHKYKAMSVLLNTLKRALLNFIYPLRERLQTIHLLVASSLFSKTNRNRNRDWLRYDSAIYLC